MRHTAGPPRVAFEMRQARQAFDRDSRRAQIRATHRASKEGQRALQQRVRSVGLGRLANAVGHTSALLEGNLGQGDKPYGVIFAKGGDESLSGGALEAYGNGAYIRARKGLWLAFPTRAVPRFLQAGGRRRRTTPELYNQSGLVQSIGRLVFRPISATRALLVIKRVTVSPKNGRAKRDTGGRVRTRIREREVVAFVLIRVTRRAQRFDKDRELVVYHRRVGPYYAEEMDRATG